MNYVTECELRAVAGVYETSVPETIVIERRENAY